MGARWGRFSQMQPWSCDWGVEFIGCRTSCQKVSLSAARHRLEPMAQLASKPDKPAKPAKASQAKKVGQAEAARRARRRRRAVRQGLLAMFVSLRWQSKICRARSPLVAACRTQKMRTSRFSRKTTRARWQKKCNAHRPSRGPTPGNEHKCPNPNEVRHCFCLPFCKCSIAALQHLAAGASCNAKCACASVSQPAATSSCSPGCSASGLLRRSSSAGPEAATPTPTLKRVVPV